MIEYYAPKYNAGGPVHTSARLGVSGRSGTGMTIAAKGAAAFS